MGAFDVQPAGPWQVVCCHALGSEPEYFFKAKIIPHNLLLNNNYISVFPRIIDMYLSCKEKTEVAYATRYDIVISIRNDFEQVPCQLPNAVVLV